MLSPRTALAARVFIFVFGRLISSTAVDAICSAGSRKTLDDGCTISDDCSKITCKIDFADEPITFKLKVNKCDDPVSVTTSMDVPDLFITWSHTYTSDDIIAVPRFTVSLRSFVSAGVYVQVALTSKGDKLRLTVKLLVGGKIWGSAFYPVKATVMEGDLPINSNDCGAFAWWYDMTDMEKGAVIGGSAVFIIIMIICCCCCCCCCCCKSNRPNNRRVTVAARPAAGPFVVSTSTNVVFPMQSLA